MFTLLYFTLVVDYETNIEDNVGDKFKRKNLKLKLNFYGVKLCSLFFNTVSLVMSYKYEFI